MDKVKALKNQGSEFREGIYVRGVRPEGEVWEGVPVPPLIFLGKGISVPAANNNFYGWRICRLPSCNGHSSGICRTGRLPTFNAQIIIKGVWPDMGAFEPM